MKSLARLAALAWLVLASSLAHAVLVPTPLPGDARLVQFEYDEDNTYLILSRPAFLTYIEFASDERILTVAGGDTKNWELTPTSSRRNLFVKPSFENRETSMTVITDKRSYQFVLRSTNAEGKWYQRVTWRYSKTVLMDLRAQEEREYEAAKVEKKATEQREAQVLGTGVRPEDLRFGYQITGDAPFRPVSIFDDGKFTWIRLPTELRELPALFGVVEGADLAIVNYVPKGEYLVIQQVLEQGVLKLGRQEVRFTREKPRRFMNWLPGPEN